MRSFIILGLMVIAIALPGSTQAVAQSGSQASAGGGASSGGGGLSGGSGSGSRGSVSGRPSLAQRQLQAQLEFQQRQAQAQQNALLQAERAKQQFKQSLVQLGLRSNSSKNSQQYRIAFQEAKQDYRALRSNQVAPNQLGVLQQPFRLKKRDIDHGNHTAKWPTALQSDELGTLVQNLDQTIMDGGVDDEESAKEFLTQLQALNVALNTSAAQGTVNATDFARSRRFITGLANEIRSSNLIM